MLLLHLLDLCAGDIQCVGSFSEQKQEIFQWVESTVITEKLIGDKIGHYFF